MTDRAAGGGRDDEGGYQPPLQVIGFVGTTRGDDARGPAVFIRGDDARRRMLIEGELAWVYGPRRHELAEVCIDDALPRGCVVLRDVAGAVPSDIIRVVKPDLDAPRRGGLFA